MKVTNLYKCPNCGFIKEYKEEPSTLIFCEKCNTLLKIKPSTSNFKFKGTRFVEGKKDTIL